VSKFLKRGIRVSLASKKRDTHKPADKRDESEAAVSGG